MMHLRLIYIEPNLFDTFLFNVLNQIFIIHFINLYSEKYNKSIVYKDVNPFRIS